MAYVIAPDGSQGTIDDSELEAALAQGFKVRQPDKEELAREAAAAAPVRAGAEAAVRGAIPALGRNLVSRFSSEFGEIPIEQARAEQALREEENPIADTLGTAVGFAVGPGKLLGGATAGLRATGLAGQAAAGAAEGGLMGLSEAIDESVLENVPLSAENIAAQSMAGALSGGVADFGLGAVGKGASLALKKMGGEGVRQSLKELGDAAITKQLFSKRDLGKNGVEENLEKIIDFGRREGIITAATTPRTGLEMAEAGLKKRSALYDQILDGLEVARPAALQGRELADDVSVALKQFDDGLLAPRAQKQMEEIRAVLESPSISWRKVHQLQSDIRDSMPLSGEPGALSTKRVMKAAQDALTDSMQKRIDSGLMAPELESLGFGSGSALKDLSREYFYNKKLVSAFKDRVASESAGGLSLTDLIVGGSVATGSPAGVIAGLPAAIASREAKRRGGFVLGGALHALADSDMLGKVANSFHKNVTKRLEMAPELLGAFRGTIEQAASQGASDLLKTHAQLANSANGREYLTTMGMIPESEEEVTAAGARLSAIEAVQRAAQAQQQAIYSAADGLFKASGTGLPPAPRGTVKDFDKTMTRIQNILQNPEGMYAQIPGDIQGGAPATAGTVASTVVNAARFLDSKAPKSPYAGMPESVAPQWQPNAVDLDRFNRYREAIESPAQVLKNMAKGYVSPEQVEAIQAVYPAMYEDLKNKINERIFSHKKPLSYSQKLAISAIMGPTALGMSPQQVQILQNSSTVTSPQGGGTKPPDGRQNVNQAKNLETQAQRIEGR